MPSRTMYGTPRLIADCSVCGNAIDSPDGEVWDHENAMDRWGPVFHDQQFPADGTIETTAFPRETYFETFMGTVRTWGCPMGELQVGDLIAQWIRPDVVHLYEVTEDCASSDNGRDLSVINLELSPDHENYEGVFAYDLSQEMNLIIFDE